MRRPTRCDAMRRLPPVFAALVAACLFAAAPATAQMPNLAGMSGTPLPAEDLPAGTVSVRLVRGDLANNIAGHPVELHGGVSLRVTTDESGRATFSNVPLGATVHAHAEVDGESLNSQDFTVSAGGGVKVMLVAGAGTAAAGAAPQAPATPAEPAAPGSVVLGGQSRVAVEFTEDGVDVYLLLDIVNSQPTAVATEPLVFTPPDGATSLTVLEGSSPRATAEARRFVVAGPFAPGTTKAQIAYRLPVSSGDLSFAQRLPADLITTNLLVRKVGAMQFRSPQAGAQREVTMQDGSPYFMATGQRLPAGTPLVVELSGVPHHGRAPRYIALGLVVFIAGLGVWWAANGPDQRLSAGRRKLEDQRETLLGRLVDIDRQRASDAGHDAARLAHRRGELMAQLERVYAQLDRDGSAPLFTSSGSGTGRAGAGAPAATR